MPQRRQEKTSAPNPAQADPAAQANFEDVLFPERPRREPAFDTAGTLVRETLPALPLAPLPEHLPIFGVKLVRVGALSVKERPRMSRPGDVAAVLWNYLKDSDREHFAALLLDAKNQLIGLTTISVGDLSSALVHPREVFKAAILANAASVILAHNHPSGDPTPSPEDVAVSRRLHEAGEILGIALLDHVVIGDGARFVSLKEKGYL